MKKFLSAFCLALVLNSGCKKEIEKIPSATHSGANTFGCLINGKAWVPTGREWMSGVNPTSGGFFGEVDNSTSIYIKAYAENDEIKIYLKNIIKTGTYDLNKTTSIKPYAVLPEASYGVYSLINDAEYVTDLEHTGTVVITYADTANRIVAGTFNMVLYQKNTCKTINIANGRFDYKNH